MKRRTISRGLGAIALGAACVANGPAASPTPPEASAPPHLDFVLQEIVSLKPGTKVGTTPFGDRNIVPILGGTFAGPLLKGKVMPGGWDWQLATPGGCMRLKADYMIQTDDGTIINVLNEGTMCPKLAGAGTRGFTTPRFEAPLGKYGWLNEGAYVGTLEVTTVDGAPAVKIGIYKAR